MSVPTSEVAQAEQDRIRQAFDSAAWGSLSSEVKDILLRRLHGSMGSPERVAAWVALVNPGLGDSVSRLGELADDLQKHVVETFLLSHAGLGEALAIEGLLRELATGGHSQDLRGKALKLLWHVIDAGTTGPYGHAYYRWLLAERCSTLTTVLREPKFREASDDDRSAILDVLGSCNRTGLCFLRELLLPTEERWRGDSRVASGTAPLFVTDLKSGSGETTLHWLAQLARASALDPRITFDFAPFDDLSYDYRVRTGRPRRPRPTPPYYPNYSQALVGVKVEKRHATVTAWRSRDNEAQHGPEAQRSLALGELVAELARPDQFLNQDNRGTCEATSMLHVVVSSQPAEYARIATELLLQGSSTLASGDTLAPPSDAYANDDSNRSPSERLTQAAVMQHWRSGFSRRDGTRADYHNVRPPRRDNTNPTGEQRDGFDRGARRDPARDDRDASRTLTNLLGRPYRTVSVFAPGGRLRPAQVIAAMRAHFQQHPDVPVIVGMSWVEGGHAIEVRGIDPQGVHHPRVRYWNPWGAPSVVWVRGFPMQQTGSSVGFTGRHMRTRRTLVGSSGAAGRSRGPEPRWRTTDGSHGRQEMAVAELQSLVESFYVPASP